MVKLLTGTVMVIISLLTGTIGQFFLIDQYCTGQYLISDQYPLKGLGHLPLLYNVLHTSKFYLVPFLVLSVQFFLLDLGSHRVEY